MPNLPLRHVAINEGVRILLLGTAKFSEMKLRLGTPRHCFVPCQNPTQVSGDKAELSVCPASAGMSVLPVAAARSPAPSARGAGR